MSAVTITNWVYESKTAIRTKALLALAKAKELEKIKQLNKR